MYDSAISRFPTLALLGSIGERRGLAFTPSLLPVRLHTATSTEHMREQAEPPGYFCHSSAADTGRRWEGTLGCFGSSNGGRERRNE